MAATPAGPATDGASSSALRVRFWASARAAAGRAELDVPVRGEVTLGEVRDLVVLALPERPELGKVLSVCSALVGETPAHDESALVDPGATVEFLPPFAGG